MRSFVFGLLLPTESVAVRAALASVLAVVLIAVLLRKWLRVPVVRSAAVLVPTAALATVVISSWGDPRLPMLMTATDGAGWKLKVGAATFWLAPMGWLLLSVWGAVAGARVARRLWVVVRGARLVARAQPLRSSRLQRRVAVLANRMELPVPRLLVADRCPGGATVVGTRHPTVVIDARLLKELDEAEADGLLAHELAHVKRRDNLVALAVGFARDLFFFLPGGRWVVRRLCEEREYAADDVATTATGRPAALASGLLKALDVRAPQACAVGFNASHQTLALRVERLITDVARPTRGRAALEAAVVAATLTAAVALAVQLPAALTSSPQEGFLLVWSNPPPRPAEPEAVAFSIMRSTPVAAAHAPEDTSPLAADDVRDFQSVVWRGSQAPRSSQPVRPQGWGSAVRFGATDGPYVFEALVASDAGVGVYAFRELPID